MYANIAKMIKVTANASTCNKGRNNYCKHCIDALSLQVKYFVDEGLPIHFVLPAFPGKSANRDKTLSRLPDMGEHIALSRLNTLLEEIRLTYNPGAKLTICSDGYVFNDIVGLSAEDVSAYKDKLRSICSSKQLEKIDFFDLTDAYPAENLTTIKAEFLKEYADSLDDIKALVKNKLDEQNLYNGLHRFLFEDLKVLYKDLSKNQVRKLAAERTYQTIQRSHAWSNLVAKYFPQAIRLSIHPHPCTSGKLTFKLVPNKNKWATPWHNVVVKTRQGVMLMKRIEALSIGAKLVGNSDVQHFVLG